MKNLLLSGKEPSQKALPPCHIRDEKDEGQQEQSQQDPG
jgi:hypothetical protein